MHYNAAALEIKSSESGLAKKKCSFLDYFFFYRSLKLAHLHLFWLRLQYSYEARFTMSTYPCIHCSQSFAPEHYLVGGLFQRYINKKVTKGILKAYYWQNQLLLNISVTNVKFDFETYQKIQSKGQKKRMVFMQEFRGKRKMGHAFERCDFKIKIK